MPPTGTVVRCGVLIGLLIFHMLACVEIVGCLPMSSSTEFVKPLATSSVGDAMSAATLRDMTNAFSTVTNDTKKIDHLIRNMFNLSLTDPTYVFRLPQDEGTNQTVVVMRKSDFMQPIFPSLTRSYIQLMQAKDVIAKDNGEDASGQDELSGQLWKEDLEGEDISALLLNLQTERSFIDYVEELNRQDEGTTNKNQDNDDEWGMLGLHGWAGSLSEPHNRDRPILTGTAKHETHNSTVKPTLKWDLPGKIIDGNLGRAVMQVVADLKAEQNFNQVKHSITLMRANHSEADVYISRTNDPFGHSTKWIMKNASYTPQEDERKKRAVGDLYSMIKCSTGCDPIVFKGYGCYCGFLGNGQAVDGIDRCCKLHDKCYENSNCISYLEYFVPYLWKCYRGKPLCAIDHGEWGGPSSCAAGLCNCDAMLSRCLRQFVCPQKRAICKTSRSRMLQNILFNF